VTTGPSEYRICFNMPRSTQRKHRSKPDPVLQDSDSDNDFFDDDNKTISSSSLSETNNDSLHVVSGRIATLLDEAQRSFAVHHRCTTAMRAIHAEDDLTFVQALVPHLNKVLLVFKKEPSVERVIEFITGYVTDPCENMEQRDELAFFILEYLLTRANAKDKAIRYRVCQIAAKILNKMGEDAEVNEDVFDKILTTMLQRARDRVPSVRAQAIATLSRLQDPCDENDQVLSEYLRVLQHDSSKEVRRAVLDNIGVSKVTLPFILARTRDSSTDVRVAAYNVIREKVDMRSLTISQRTSIMYEGLRDRKAVVQQACTNVLCDAWMKKVDGDVIKLLERMDVESFPKKTATLLTFIIQHGDISNTAMPPYRADELSAESAVFWRVYIECAQQSGRGAAIIDRCMPETVTFIDILRFHENDQFISTELMKLAEHVDFAEEAGRRAFDIYLNGLLKDTLVNDDFIVHALKIVRLLHPDENDLIRLLLEMISDFRDPLESKDDASADERRRMEQRQSEIVAELEELQAEKEVCIETENYADAAVLKKQISALEAEEADIVNNLAGSVSDDERSWLRMLTLAADMLQFTRKNLKHPGLLGLLDTVILPAVGMANPFIRNAGIRCLGLFSLLDQQVARNHLNLFLQVIANDRLELQQTAMNIVFDLLMVFERLLDDDANASDDSENTAELPDLYTVIQSLAGYLIMPDAAQELRDIAVEGLAKLMIYDRFNDTTILSLFFLLYFNPATVENTHLRQCLTVFFPAYANSNPTRHRKAILQVFVPTIRAVTTAPAGSDMQHISGYQMAQFFVFLLGDPQQDIIHYTKQWRRHFSTFAGTQMLQLPELRHATFFDDRVGLSYHDKLAFELASQIVAANGDMLSAESKVYCQTLKLLNVGTFTRDSLANTDERMVELMAQMTFIHWYNPMSVLSTFVEMLEQVKERITDKTVLRSLDKLIDQHTKSCTSMEAVADQKAAEASTAALNELVASRIGYVEAHPNGSDDEEDDSDEEDDCEDSEDVEDEDEVVDEDEDDDHIDGPLVGKTNVALRRQSEEHKQPKKKLLSSRRRVSLNSDNESSEDDGDDDDDDEVEEEIAARPVRQKRTAAKKKPIKSKMNKKKKAAPRGIDDLLDSDDSVSDSDTTGNDSDISLLSDDDDVNDENTATTTSATRRKPTRRRLNDAPPPSRRRSQRSAVSKNKKGKLPSKVGRHSARNTQKLQREALQEIEDMLED
jgi:condensin complex subunit 3